MTNPHDFPLRPQSSFKIAQTLQDLVESKEDAIHWVDEPEKDDLGFLQDVGSGAYIYKLHNATFYRNTTLPPYFGTKVATGPRKKQAEGLLFEPHRASILLTSDGCVFSESFGRNTTAPFELSIDGGVIRFQHDLPKVEDLVGEPSLFVELFMQHFGHALVDMTTRFWPLSLPNAPLLSYLHFSGAGMNSFKTGLTKATPSFVRKILAAVEPMGKGLTFVDKPIRYKELYIPSRITPHYGSVGPRYLNLMRMIGRTIAPEDSNVAQEKIFLSRSKLAPGSRSLRSETEALVEDCFSRRGFQIIHPQEIPFEEQIRTVRQAKFLAGLAGSQLHLSVFSEPEKIGMFRIRPKFYAGITDPPILKALGGQFHDFVSENWQLPPDTQTVPEIGRRSWDIPKRDMKRLEREIDQWLSI